jgi:hypothetical protein
MLCAWSGSEQRDPLQIRPPCSHYVCPGPQLSCINHHLWPQQAPRRLKVHAHILAACHDPLPRAQQSTQMADPRPCAGFAARAGNATTPLVSNPNRLSSNPCPVPAALLPRQGQPSTTESIGPRLCRWSAITNRMSCGILWYICAPAFTLTLPGNSLAS